MFYSEIQKYLYKIGTNCPLIKPGICRYRSASGLTMDFRSKMIKLKKRQKRQSRDKTKLHSCFWTLGKVIVIMESIMNV